MHSGLGVAFVQSMPIARRVAGSNLALAAKYRPWTLTHNYLRGRQRESTSLISSTGAVKSQRNAFGQRTIIIICTYLPAVDIV